MTAVAYEISRGRRSHAAALDFEVYLTITERRDRSRCRQEPTAEQEFLPFYTAYSSDDRPGGRKRNQPSPRTRLGSAAGNGGAAKRHGGSAFEDYVGSEISSSRSSTQPRRPSAATCASCRCRRCAPTATSCCRCRSEAGRATSPSTVAAAAAGKHPPFVKSGPSRPSRSRWPTVPIVLARHQPSVAQLSVARRKATCAKKAPPRCADLLELYAPSADIERQEGRSTGIRSVPVRRVGAPPAAAHRRAGIAPARSPLAFGRGLEIVVQVDELAFEGTSAFLLGSVLDRYFARHVSINSFTETVLRSQSRGEINRWGQQWGARPTL